MLKLGKYFYIICRLTQRKCTGDLFKLSNIIYTLIVQIKYQGDNALVFSIGENIGSGNVNLWLVGLNQNMTPVGFALS